MNTQRPIAFVLASLLLIWSGSAAAWAQSGPGQASLGSSAGGSAQISGTIPDSRAGLVTLQRSTGAPELVYGALPSAGFQATFEDWYWSRNFYSADLFVPWNVNPGTDYFWTHFVGSATEEGDLAGNFGLGYGYYVDEWDRLLRAGFYLDVDGQPDRSQVGGSLYMENLGERVDIRSEIGLVFTDTTNTLVDGLTGTSSFMGNMLLIDAIKTTETSFNHGNVEIGGPFWWFGEYGINVYGQLYYLWNTDAERKTLGGGIRAEWTITEDITFNVNHTSDDIFENSTWLNLAVTTPDGLPRHFARQVPVRERFSKRPVRNGRIPTRRETKRPSLKAINPKTGEPYYVVHVDPDAAGGSGTFENPLGSIDELIAANDPTDPNNIIDIIYVRPADTVSGAADLRVSNGNDFILRDNQFLLGSTLGHVIPIQPNATFGVGSTAFVAPVDPGSPKPLLGSDNFAPGAVVYAADGNIIAGFTIDGDGFHDGIRGDGNSILGDLIDDNVIRMIQVSDVTFQNTNIGINLPDLSDGPAMPGMGIGSTLLNNDFVNNQVAFDIGIDANNNNATDVDTVDDDTLTLTVIGNTVVGNQEGGILRSQGPGALLDMSFRDLDGDGNVDRVFDNNEFSGNAGNGLSIAVETGARIRADLGELPGFVQDIDDPSFSNIFAGNGGNGLDISGSSSEDNVNRINYRGNLFQGNGGSGVDILTGGDAIFVFTGEQNVYMQNVMHGLEITSLNNSSIGDPNSFMQPPFPDADPSQSFVPPLASASIFDSEYFLDNEQDGINIQAQDQSWQNIAILGTNGRTIIDGNENNGITLVNNSVPTVDGNNPIESYYTIRGAEITQSGADGINILLEGGESSLFPENAVERTGPNVVTIGGPTSDDRVFIVGSGDQGVQVEVAHDDTGVFNGNPTVSSVLPFDSNGNFAPDRFYIEQLTALDNVSDGFEIHVNLNSDVNFNVLRSNFIGNGGVGLEMELNSANDFQLFNLVGGVPQNVFAYGIGSVFNIGTETAGSGNLFQSNGLQGVYFGTQSPVTPGTLNNNPRVVSGLVSVDAMNPVPPQNTQGSLTSGEYASVEDTFFYTIGRLNFYDNIVRTNGTPQNGADGLALSVGTSTNVVASIAQNTFGGNTGADLNIVAVVSQNPEQSIDNFASNPNRDLIAPDPVGILDLALGQNFTDPDPPVSGEAPTGANPNTGAQFVVNTIGLTTPLAGRTEVGIFTNSDHIKPANRNGFIIINAFGTMGNINQNVWTQSGPAFVTLQNANFNLGNTFNNVGTQLIAPFSTVNFVGNAVFP